MSALQAGDIFSNQRNPYEFKGSRYIKMKRTVLFVANTEIEVGFYYGTSYVSYTDGCFSVYNIRCLVGANRLFIDDNRIFYWLALNAAMLVLLQPIFMRLSRTYSNWFVKYDPDWGNQ